MKDIYIDPVSMPASVKVTRKQPTEMYRLILPDPSWKWWTFANVGCAVEVEWYEDGVAHFVAGDVCYKRNNIIHINGLYVKG